ncbi:hypothetical protein FRC12_017774 [Ceratobasidium sp. 428]|nr:hypothetical protein FRC12_017774 [Ceratobasidium sp. 428]
MSTPRSLAPGDCNLDIPLPDNSARMEHPEEFFFDADYVLTPPASPASAASEHSAHFLGDKAEQRYRDNFLEVDYLPPPAHLGLDPEMLDSNNEDDDEDDDAYRGIDFQPENSRSHRVNEFLLRNSLEVSSFIVPHIIRVDAFIRILMKPAVLRGEIYPQIGAPHRAKHDFTAFVAPEHGLFVILKEEALDLFARPDIHQLMKHFPGMFL